MSDKGIIITWNPQWWNAWQPSYEAQREMLLRGEEVPKTRWSVGAHRHGIHAGMQAWLYRQGPHDRGIHAMATVLGDIYEDSPWRPGAVRPANYVPVRFTELFTVAETILVPVLESAVPAVRWRAMRQSGTILDSESTQQLAELWDEWSV